MRDRDVFRAGCKTAGSERREWHTRCIFRTGRNAPGPETQIAKNVERFDLNGKKRVAGYELICLMSEWVNGEKRTGY